MVRGTHPAAFTQRQKPRVRHASRQQPPEAAAASQCVRKEFDYAFSQAAAQRQQPSAPGV